MSRDVRRIGLTLGLPLLLFGCGTAPPHADPAPDPSANGQHSPWADQAGSGVLPQSLTLGTNTLQYEQLRQAYNGWGPVEKNRSNGEQAAGDGKTLTLNGKTYAQGYGVHAGSTLDFRLLGAGGRCTRFMVDIGVDDEVGDRGSVIFRVLLDGVQVYDSGVMTGASATRHADVNIAGKRNLELVVLDAGDGISYDHANWAGPQLYCEPAPAATPGLDPTFGEGGVTAEYIYAAFSFWKDGASDAQGRLVVVGHIGYRDQNARLVRFLPNGALDRSFGVETAFPGPVPEPDGTYDRGSSYPSKVLIDARGRILIAGAVSTRYGSSFSNTDASNFLLARYQTDGTPDKTFGQGGSVQTTLRRFSEINALTLDAQGRLLVAGRTSSGRRSTYPLRAPYDFAVARYTPDGTLDPTFGTGGTVITTFGAGDSEALTLSTDAQGRLLVAGTAGERIALARYTPDGTLDPGFGQGGQVTGSVSSSVADVALDARGRLVVAGTAAGDFVVSRYGADGTPDPTFGTGGRVVTDFAGRNDAVRGVAVDAQGRIAVVGSSDTNFAAARYTTNGAPDPTFGKGGQSVLDVSAFLGGDSARLNGFTNSPGANGVVIDGQQRLVAFGVSSSAWNFGYPVLAVTRSNP